MRSELNFSTLKIRTTQLKKSEFPDLLGHSMLQNNINFKLGEDEEIFEGFGTRSNAFPYQEQNLYSRQLEEKEFKTAILENDYIKATFLLELGGRLWSLIDKTTNRNLLYTNDVIQYSNLAILNAWFSGGVEWNIGMIGHTPFTNEPLYTATVDSEYGYPVLRMYEMERVRAVTYQMDFFLPEDSKSLLCRMRVTNEKDQVVPMYWWSNIAVPEYPEGRIVMPADSAYSFIFDENNRGSVQKVDIPYVDGFDVSHYCNIEKQVDYFFDLDKSPIKFLAQTDKEGFGLMHLSTSRLRSRKMFSWGNNVGSDSWQNFLTDKAGRYLEVQAGVGKTQYGCIPMPPNSSWEWLESYGPIQLDATKDWEDFKVEATDKATTIFNTLNLEVLLKESRATIAKKEGKLIQTGSPASGFARYLRPSEGRRVLTSQLEFPLDKTIYSNMISLLEEGKAVVSNTKEPPKAYFNEDEIFSALLAQKDRTWDMDYNLALLYYYREEFKLAQKFALSSIEKETNVWAYHALAATYFKLGNAKKSAKSILEAVKLRSNSLPILRDAFKLLLKINCYKEAIALYEDISNKEIKADLRLTTAYMIALYKEERFSEAYALISKDGGLVPDDIREGNDEIETIYQDLITKLKLDTTVPNKVKFRSL